MTLLMHVCCGNCLIYPYRILKEEGISMEGYWFNPNIHPYSEHQKRLFSMAYWSGKKGFIFREEPYDWDLWREAIQQYEDRCFGCYMLRLRKTAEKARELKYDAFTTTLLYSIYQKHEIIRKIGETLAKETGVKFLYKDFRTGWKEGNDESRRMHLYRQRYCGCLASESEREMSGGKK
ncbi:MAG TPA: epoxyqueuosine reductase QueH [bacterium]|nr:epoxyqueuosine reductase QueH [bacterium]